MSVMMLSLFLYAEDVYDLNDGDGLAWMRHAYRVASAILATPVMFLCAWPLVVVAIQRLRTGRLSMEALIVSGCISAYVLSCYNLYVGNREIYFDCAVIAALLATFGRFLEATARARASQVLGPTVEPERNRVRAVVDGDVSADEYLPQSLLPGMSIEVQLDCTVPVDVELERDVVEVQLGVITGESVPVCRRPGDFVPAGAVVLSDCLRGKVLRCARESTLERLAALALSLRETPSGLQKFADLLAAALTPLVAFVAGATLLYWYRAESLEQGIVNSLSVVLVACPCSYAIATPLVHWMSLRHALSRGVLIRRTCTIEDMSRVVSIAFDKTGTLTGSVPRITHFNCMDAGDNVLARGIVRGLEKNSSHPIAKALMSYCGEGSAVHVSARTFVPGSGVVGRDDDGEELILGSRRFLRDNGVDCSASMGLAKDGELLAGIEMGEDLRPEAKTTVDALAGMSIASTILTGDSKEHGQIIADQLSIDCACGLTPEEKLGIIKSMGDRVAMVGDGINDAPALASQCLGFAVKSGVDLARGMAAVVLLHDDLRLVPWSLSLARSAMRIARSLLAISTCYNIIFISMAAGGVLRPVFAGISMFASSLLTLLSVLTLVSRNKFDSILEAGTEVTC
jgi:Cu+-exporting ATPase